MIRGMVQRNPTTGFYQYYNGTFFIGEFTHPQHAYDACQEYLKEIGIGLPEEPVAVNKFQQFFLEASAKGI
jgi:hypothetical protein